MREVSGLSVSGQRANHEARILGTQSIVTEAETFQNPGTKLLEEDVVRAQQTLESRATFGPFEIQKCPSFASVEEVKRSRHQMADIIATAEILELVHSRPEIREDKGREGAGQEAREVEEAEACERTRHEPIIGSA